VANDAAWWKAFPHAVEFAGRRFSVNKVAGVEQFPHSLGIGTHTCSGVLALEVAKSVFDADEILLLGADFHGDHYFGRYSQECRNTNESRRLIHARQFSAWAALNPCVRVINCTPGSALRCFRHADLQEELCALSFT
jgi:hypothetical protein